MRSARARARAAWLLGVALLGAACGGGPAPGVGVESGLDPGAVRLAEGSGRTAEGAGATAEASGAPAEGAASVPGEPAAPGQPAVLCATLCARAVECGLEEKDCAKKCTEYASNRSATCFDAAVALTACLVSRACGGEDRRDATRACAREHPLPAGCDD